MTESTRPDEEPQAILDHVLVTTRELVEGVFILEHRLASVAVLAERFGTRYLQRATRELQASADELARIEQRRRAAVTEATTHGGFPPVDTLSDLVAVTSEPLRSFLIDARTELAAAQLRISVLRGRADDILGRRITLIVETLGSPGDITGAIYGRSLRPRPRLVSAHL